MALYGFDKTIRSIQRGTIVVASNSSSNTATITSVNTGKTVLNALGAQTGNVSATIKDLAYFLYLTNATTVTATRKNSTVLGAYPLKISYEVLEFA